MTSSVETVTILITDLVGSTQLETRLGPAVADGLRHEHFGVLREAVAETGGSEVKNIGDGLMIAFRSASAAVDCAIAMQHGMAHRNRSSEEPLHVRIGVGTGDATAEESDFFGMPSIEAARLCDKAGADGILVTEVVRIVARRAGDVFIPVGKLTLKGLPEPVAAFEVQWERPGARGGVPLQTALPYRAELDFVGRRAEQAVLEQAWRGAVAGSGRVLLVSGEPGIGKTRLLTEFALAAHRDGATVLFGRCDEEIGLPFQPFAEPLRHYLAACPPPRLAPLAPLSASLARLAPELVDRLPPRTPPRQPERRSDDRLMSDAVRETLASASRHAPTVLVIDDLQWAPGPSLLVLRDLARASGSLSLLVLGAYRDTEVAGDHPLGELSADLKRKGRADPLPLSGLAGDEVAALVGTAAQGSQDGDPDLPELLRRETGGNPFLIGELLREGGTTRTPRVPPGTQPWDMPSSVAVPDAVGASVHARLAQLSEEARRALAAGAAIGERFDAALAAGIAGLEELDSLAAFDEAVAAGLVRAEGAAGGRYGFVNALMHRAIYGELPTSSRVSLHREIAERLEAVGADRVDELADHWFAATLPAGAAAQEVAMAIGYAERAAQRAAAAGTFPVAARHHRHAWQLAEAADAGSRRHCVLLLAAGDAHARASERTLALEAFHAAAEVARRIGEPELFTVAALGYGLGPGEPPSVAPVDERLVGLLEEALAGVDGESSALRVRVLARLAVALYPTGFVERREELGRQAVELAAALDDPETHLVALYGWLVATWSPDELAGRIAGSDDVMGRARELDDVEMVHRAHALRLRALLELGDLEAIDRELDALDESTAASGQPPHEWEACVYQAMRALHVGATAAGGERMHEAAAAGRLVDPDAAGRTLAAQASLHAWLAGERSELVPALRQAVADCPWLPVRRAQLAFGLAEAGRMTEAITEFEALALDDFATLPRDAHWLLTHGFLAFTCALIHDRPRAALIADALAPYEDRFLAAGDATFTWGPVATALALLAAALGREDEAVDHFERALERNAASGAAGQQVFVQREFARLLLARGRRGDRGRAAALLQDAEAACSRHGFGGLAEQVRALRDELAGSAEG